MQEAAFAGVSECEFWESTPKFLHFKIKGANRRSQEAWEIARYNAWICISPHVKKGISMRKLGLFPWEKPKTKRLEYDPEELAQFEKNADKLFINGFNK